MSYSINDFNLNKIYPNLFGKKNRIETKIKTQIKKNIPKIMKFIPDEKTIINQDENSRTDWPKSGWIIKRNNTIDNKINV